MKQCHSKFKEVTFWQWVVGPYCGDTKSGVFFLAVATLIFCATSWSLGGTQIHLGYVPLIIGVLILSVGLIRDLKIYYVHVKASDSH